MQLDDIISRKQYILFNMTRIVCQLLIFLGLIIDIAIGECPDGFVKHRESCYKIWDTLATFPEATALCKIYNTHLATVMNENEEDFLAGEMSRHATYADKYFWIGGADILIEGEWRWITNLDSIYYMKWASGQPDNHVPTSEHCLAIHYSGLTTGWYDMPCFQPHNFICETRAHSDQHVTINVQTHTAEMLTHFLTQTTPKTVTDQNGNVIGEGRLSKR